MPSIIYSELEPLEDEENQNSPRNNNYNPQISNKSQLENEEMIDALKEIESKIPDEENMNFNHNVINDTNEAEKNLDNPNNYSNIIEQKDNEGNLRKTNPDEAENENNLNDNNLSNSNVNNNNKVNENQSKISNDNVNLLEKSGIEKSKSGINEINKSKVSQLDSNELGESKSNIGNKSAKSLILNKSKVSAKSNNKVENSNLNNSNLNKGDNEDKKSDINK